MNESILEANRMPDAGPAFRTAMLPKCSQEDSNLHGLPHTVLSRTRLPVPPRELEIGGGKLTYPRSLRNRNQPRRFLRARFSSACALRALPSERRRSA